MPSLEELDRTLEARMEEILHDARTLDRSPRSTITPDRSKADAPGRLAVELLRKLGPSGAGIELKGTIGEGGMGIVRAGHQVALGREVAVKTLKDEARSEAATLKLLREAWVTGALEHPNVVPIYDISLDDNGSPRIVLKKIGGSDWSGLMRDDATIKKRFQARDAFEWNVRILMQVCNAVHFAHARGILHRDLKPENVMIGEFGEVYVLDWGIAVSMKDDGTGRLPLAKDATDIAGTPAYMAPEMLGGKRGILTERTDVYLLGSILYEIVAGAPPHQGTGLMAILHQVVKSNPVMPESTPEELSRIVKRAMDADPHARFETAEQLRLALAGFLEHRVSLKLATEAETRLREIEEERATPGPDPDEARLRLYHLFGECRFGFLEALKIWRDNEPARAGLRRAISTMIELELEQGDPKAAALLLGELDDPPADLVSRVTAAKQEREVEEKRRLALARDLDPSIGRRTRFFVSLILGVTWTVAPLFGWWWEMSHESGHSRAIASTMTMLAGGAALAYWARDSMSRTAINRRLVRSVAFTLTGQLGLFAGAWAVGIPYAQTRPLLMLLYTVAAALIVGNVEGRLWPAAVAMGTGFVMSCIWPPLTFPFESAANLILTINVVLIWGQREDVVAPIRDRHEARMRAWQEFLEKKHKRESVPPEDLDAR